MTQAPAAPEESAYELSYDPDEAFAAVAGDVRDPYPDLAVQRSAAPVHEVDMRTLMGLPQDAELPATMARMFTAFSYEAVHQVLKDDETFSSKGYEQVMGQVMGHTILEMDAPEHPRKRNLVARGFRTRMLERWSETLIRKTVDDLLDRIVDKGKADLVRSLTFPFPVKVISRILGLPDEDWPQFQRWSIELIGVGVDYQRGLEASAKLKEYFSKIVEQKRSEPGDDLITQLVQAEVDGQKLDDEEIYAFLRLLLPAGAETTFRSSGNLLYGLLTHIDQLEAVKKDRSLLPQAIEEALRWEPPLLFIMRTASKDTELCGVQIPAGAMVNVCMGAANRDPERFERPDEFDIFRDARQHISFGGGPHLCLGMHLARLETRALINQVLDRLPNLRLDPEGEDPHIHGMTFRSPTSLPVLYDAS